MRLSLIECIPSAENRYRKIQEGQFDEYGLLIKGRTEYEPSAENGLRKKEEGELDNGKLIKGRVEITKPQCVIEKQLLANGTLVLTLVGETKLEHMKLSAEGEISAEESVGSLYRSLDDSVKWLLEEELKF